MISATGPSVDPGEQISVVRASRYDQIVVDLQDARARSRAIADERDQAAEMAVSADRYRIAITGPDEDNPRWRCLTNAAESLRRIADHDDDPEGVAACAEDLDALRQAIQTAASQIPTDSNAPTIRRVIQLERAVTIMLAAADRADQQQLDCDAQLIIDQGIADFRLALSNSNNLTMNAPEGS